MRRIGWRMDSFIRMFGMRSERGNGFTQLRKEILPQMTQICPDETNA